MSGKHRRRAWVSRTVVSSLWLIALCAIGLPVVVDSNLLDAAPASKELVNSIGMKFVTIPAGEFMMGGTDQEVAKATKLQEREVAKKGEKTKKNPDRQQDLLDRLEGTVELLESQKPQHKVKISKSFHLGMYEVTQQDFTTIMGYNPSAFAKGGSREENIEGHDTRRHPVDSVSWDDAQEFCKQLSTLPAEVAAGRTYRLPTEAEWEYACRAGTTTRFYFGDLAGPEVREKEEYGKLVDKVGKVTLPVGGKSPNPWGLYDVFGNVTEWCQDWYDVKAYANSTSVDPTGPSQGVERVVRGGAAVWNPPKSTSAYRRKFPPESFSVFRGFRVVCETPAAAVADTSTTKPKQDSAAKAMLEAVLKSKGLVKQGSYYVHADEAEFIRYVAALERLRVACFTADRECNDAKYQLKVVDQSKIAAVQSRMDARSQVNYSYTWREHRYAARARNIAHDAMVIAELTKDGIKEWLSDANGDFKKSVSRFEQQSAALKKRFDGIKRQAEEIANDAEVKKALAQLNAMEKTPLQLGPGPAALSALKKVTKEDEIVQQLKSR